MFGCVGERVNSYYNFISLTVTYLYPVLDQFATHTIVQIKIKRFKICTLK